MKIQGAVALVTGANRGLGRHLAAELIERGATVYAGARNPASVDLPGAIPVRVDVTDLDSIAEAAARAGDLTLLVNNAGISAGADLLTSDWSDIRAEMEVNFYGSLSTVRAFAPIIAGNGGGAILNVLSVLAWLHLPQHGSYATTKAAGWAMTDVLREQLKPSDIAVTGLYVAYLDTDMAANVPPENKTDPRIVAAKAVDGIEEGVPEVLADDVTTQVKASLSGA